MQCQTYEFYCGRIGGCIHGTYVCDGIKDCDNGADEANCTVGGNFKQYSAWKFYNC